QNGGPSFADIVSLCVRRRWPMIFVEPFRATRHSALPMLHNVIATRDKRTHEYNNVVTSCPTGALPVLRWSKTDAATWLAKINCSCSMGKSFSTKKPHTRTATVEYPIRMAVTEVGHGNGSAGRPRNLVS